MANYSVNRSLEIIQESQAASGAFLASPNFPTYHYCWFRDGAFIAYAMDLYGQHQSARRFHDWAAEMVNQRADAVRGAVETAKSGASLSAKDILHTRYTADGQESGEEWANYQLDGLGTWIWSLEQHQNLAGQQLTQRQMGAAALAADYLSVLWQIPCYDCWEEFSDRVHPHTLAAIYGGLQSEARLNNRDHTVILDEIADFLSTKSLDQGAFVKFIGSQEVDASLLGLAVPYRVFPIDDDRIHSTVARIETELRVSKGGVHRYRTDTYYGGGEWVLLTAWLGWYYAVSGDQERAADLLRQVETCADSEGNLPEQVPVHLNNSSYYPEWVARWGEIARPLLWSHAMALVLRKFL